MECYLIVLIRVHANAFMGETINVLVGNMVKAINIDDGSFGKVLVEALMEVFMKSVIEECLEGAIKQEYW